MLGRPQCCLEAVGNVDLSENVIQVGLHRMRTDVKSLSNLIIGGPYSDQGKYPNLPRSEGLAAAS